MSFEAKLGVWRIICTAPVGKYCRNILTEFMNGFLGDWLAIGKHSLKVKNVRLITGKTGHIHRSIVPDSFLIVHAQRKCAVIARLVTGVREDYAFLVKSRMFF